MVAVLVKGLNDKPVVVNETNYEADEGQVFTIPSRSPTGSGLLDNDSDADQDGFGSDDVLNLLDKPKTVLGSGSSYEIIDNQMILDLSDSQLIDSLAEGDKLEHEVNYLVSDGSLVFTDY